MAIPQTDRKEGERLVTRESIHAAKLAAAFERELEHCSNVVYLPHVQTVTIGCPQCGVTATALNEGRAVKMLTHHIMTAHRPQES